MPKGHFEIPFDGKARATKFYTQAFDWKLQDMPELSYVMDDRGGQRADDSDRARRNQRGG